MTFWDKKFAIFDMDGVLVDSMGYWRGLGSDYLHSQGVTDEAAVQDAMERVKPMTMSESAAYFIERFGLSATAESVRDDMNRIMEEHYKHDVPLKKGAYELVHELKRRGVKMCVASSTDGELVKLCLGRLGIADCFSFMLSCEEVGSGKDKPDTYLEAARRLGCSADEAVIFEDALYAVRTAVAAGFYVVAVVDDYNLRNMDELRVLADEVVDFEIGIGIE
ncbi:MAG: HAD family phosphatase [Eubacteriales bacterium]|nr:HAD family phosphatase [Eubacteriales bacterium]